MQLFHYQIDEIKTETFILNKLQIHNKSFGNQGQIER